MVESKSGSAKTLGNYKLLKKLGEGGFGKVFLAIDLESGEHVAVKTFKPDKGEKAKFKKSFEAECEAAKQELEHPNVLVIEAAGLLPIKQNNEAIGKPVYYTVSKLAENSEAFEFVEAAEGLKDRYARTLFGQLMSAVAYIH